MAEQTAACFKVRFADGISQCKVSWQAGTAEGREHGTHSGLCSKRNLPLQMFAPPAFVAPPGSLVLSPPDAVGADEGAGRSALEEGGQRKRRKQQNQARPPRRAPFVRMRPLSDFLPPEDPRSTAPGSGRQSYYMMG